MVEIRLSRAGASQRVESAVLSTKQLMTPDYRCEAWGRPDPVSSLAGHSDGMIPVLRSQLDEQLISTHMQTTGRLPGTCLSERASVCVHVCVSECVCGTAQFACEQSAVDNLL